VNDILQEIAKRNGRGKFYMPRNRFVGDNAKYLKHKVFVPTAEYLREVTCPNGCGEDSLVCKRGKRYFALCNHRAVTEEFEVVADEVEQLLFDEVAFAELLNTSRELSQEYNSLVKAELKPKHSYPLGTWAARYVESYDRVQGFVLLKRGNQRRFEIPPTSNKAWDILEDLFTTGDPKGLVKLPTSWKSNFVRKIGSTGEKDLNSDIVKISAFIRQHTPGKGRACDGMYYFKPTRT